MLFSKSLRISSAVRSSYGVGKITTLQSNDAAKLFNLPQYLHMLWSGPVCVLGGRPAAAPLCAYSPPPSLLAALLTSRSFSSRMMCTWGQRDQRRLDGVFLSFVALLSELGSYLSSELRALALRRVRCCTSADLHQACAKP